MNITYLFGAGASKNALPIVNELPKKLDSFIGRITSSEFALDDTTRFTDLNTNVSKREIQNEFIQDLNWLLTECKRHASIDTFAKKLYIKKKHNELKRLKATLSAYFVFEQSMNNVDKRYDSFFASILNKSNQDFPENVKILSWNYDYQFEKAYSEFTDWTDLEDNQNALRVISKHTLNNSIDNKFSIYKINGTTSAYQDQGHFQFQLLANIKEELNLPLIESVLRNYKALLINPNIHPTLSFAWETLENDKITITEKAILGTKNTEILIVIGYSFPYFNREIDRKIINSMNNLRKVYFQAPDADKIKERFLSIRDNLDDKNLVPRFDIDMFLLPNEF